MVERKNPLSFEEMSVIVSNAAENFNDEATAVQRLNALSNLVGKYISMNALKVKRQNQTGKLKFIAFLD